MEPTLVQVVDTNVLVRYLVGDNPAQQKQAKVWFQEAEKGKRKLAITTIVIAEVCFVLESFYKLDRDIIADACIVLLSQKWLQVEDRDVLTDLWKWYKQKLHFVDIYLIAWSQRNKGSVLSFDKELVRKIER